MSLEVLRSYLPSRELAWNLAETYYRVSPPLDRLPVERAHLTAAFPAAERELDVRGHHPPRFVLHPFLPSLLPHRTHLSTRQQPPSRRRLHGSLAREHFRPKRACAFVPRIPSFFSCRRGANVSISFCFCREQDFPEVLRSRSGFARLG